MEWIKVENQLPKTDGNNSIMVLVFTKRREILCRPYNEYHNCFDDYDGDDYWTDAIGGEVTHWMPLPEKPKSE